MAEVTIQTDTRRTLITGGIIGLLVGVGSWLFNILLQRILVEPLFCQSPDSFAVCQNGGTISLVISLIIMSVVALFLLIKAGFFRPLLIVLAVLLAFAGMNTWLGGLAWWEATIWHGLLFALGFALFAWIATLRTFVLAGITTLVVIVAIRALFILL